MKGFMPLRSVILGHRRRRSAAIAPGSSLAGNELVYQPMLRSRDPHGPQGKCAACHQCISRWNFPYQLLSSALSPVWYGPRIVCASVSIGSPLSRVLRTWVGAFREINSTRRIPEILPPCTLLLSIDANLSFNSAVR